MKFRINSFTLWVALSFAMVACTNDETNSSSDKTTAVNVSAGIRTRAVNDQWQAGDGIGLTMLKKGTTEVAEDAANRYYTTDDGTGSFSPAAADQTIYFPQDGSEVLFKAFFPYRDDIASNFRIPVSVTDQSSLPAIDLMTAEHVKGTSKADPNVELRFHHRLSKLIFNLKLDTGEELISLNDCALTIKGMKTTGTYELMSENLLVNDGSDGHITIPIGAIAEKREGIVMPRKAGAGVLFEFKAKDGGIYTALMSSDLELKGGYKYIFNITLKKTPVTVSATIVDWIEGPTVTENAVTVGTPAGASSGVTVGAAMKLYTGSDLLTTYTYNSEGTWDPEKLVYWESIITHPTKFHASIIASPALHESQLADILIAEEVEVEHYNGVNLNLAHAASQVIVKLVSKDSSFTGDELKKATVTLPSYQTGGAEAGGYFVPGTATGNVVVDMKTGIALFQPQAVKADDVIAVVTINGTEYKAIAAAGGYSFAAGVSTQLTLNVGRTKVDVSAKIIPWRTVTDNLDMVIIGTPAGPSDGVNSGDEMKVYLQQLGNAYDLLRTYTYNEDGKWYPGSALYWEEIEADPAHFRASIVAAGRLHETQLPDLLIADDISVQRHAGANFEFRHVAAKAIVKLISTDGSFTPEELKAADITIKFPGYLMGGKEENGSFIPGTARGDIVADRTDKENAIALFQPVTVAKGAAILIITIKGRDYTVVADNAGFTFTAGEARAMTISLNKVKMTVSAKVIDWTANSVDLTTVAVGTPAGASEGVQAGDLMTVYTGTDAARTEMNTYKYDGTAWKFNNPGNITYWEELSGASVDFYAWIKHANKLNNTQLDDYFVGKATAAYGNGVHFELKHAAAQVAVQVKLDDSFTAEEQAMIPTAIKLPGYKNGAQYENGMLINQSVTTGDIDVAIRTVDGATTAVAMIQEQTIAVGAVIAQVTFNGKLYVVKSSSSVEFKAGVITKLVIALSKTHITVSTKVIEWTDGATIPLNGAIQITGTGTTEGFTGGESMKVYQIENSTVTTYSYAYNGTSKVWSGSPSLYWDDVKTTQSLSAAYFPAGVTTVPTTTNGTFDCNLPASQSGGYTAYDWYIGDKHALTSPKHIHFTFKHALSKVVVKLVASDGFTDSDLNGATVQLSNFKLKGTASVVADIPNVNPTVADNEATQITLCPSADGKRHDALVIPQPVHTIDLSIKLAGQELPVTASHSSLTFVANQQQVITVTLKKTDISLSAKLEEWTNGVGGGVVIE